MQLFFNEELDKNSKNFTFDSGESKHIVKVLRGKVNDQLKITNGKGLFFTARITTSDPKSCSVEIIKVKKDYPKKHWLHMAVAPTKMNDRYEWFLEKATEIGVHEITPIICKRSERKVVKLDRYKKVVQAAMKQSFQSYLPKINEPVSLTEFLEESRKGLLFMAHCEDSERFELKRSVAPDNPVTILIGPEGDFTPSEIKNAAKRGYLSVSMGDNRLRTETAAIVACTTVALINSR